MKVLILLMLFISFSLAKLKVVATYLWIGDLVKEVGGESVEVYVIAKPTEDFHFVVPKPSHIAKLRSADLLVINGASLEIGFLPPLLQQSNNPKIQPGRDGFLDLSQFVELIEKPQVVSRQMGDVHPEGNPHYHLDPHNIPSLAKAVAERLCKLDAKGCPTYRSNLEVFLNRWSSELKEWDAGFSKLRGLKVVQYHKTYNYLFKRYRIETMGTVEPLPGIPPTAKHIKELTQKAKGAKFVVVESFRGKEIPQRVATELGARLLVLPQDVGAEDVRDLFELYSRILKSLSQ